jgi:hypothetical protein
MDFHIVIATGSCIANQLRDVNTICRRRWYIAAHIWKIYDFKIEVVPLIINFSTEFKKVKHATPRNKWSVCWSSSSITYLSPLEGYCFSRSSEYQWVRIVSHVKLKALASWIFLSFTSFWKNYDSYQYTNKSARRGTQFVPIGIPTTCWNRQWSNQY